MKVLNLRCAGGHLFEGWFGSDDDFIAQNGRGAIECPMCADRIIARMPQAPRLNLSGGSSSNNKEPPAESAADAKPDPAAEMQSRWLQLARHVLQTTEDVGDRFPDEARRMHYGEIGERGIRGRATADERRELLDEGIEVVPLPLPVALKGPVQ
jgi:hypothetical protein